MFVLCVLVYFQLSALADGPVGPSSDFAGVEDISAGEYFSLYLTVLTAY